MLRLKIREVAEAKGHNMSSLSRSANLAFTTVKRIWYDPYAGVNTQTLERIAAALGVSVSDLFDEIPDED